MASVNKVILMGNLGRDPEINQGQKMRATLSIATSYSTRDASGNRQEQTDWHRVVLFDGLAKIAAEYLKKGRTVYVEGRLKTRSWTDNNGQTQWITEVVADSMQMIGSSGGAPKMASEQAADSAPAPQSVMSTPMASATQTPQMATAGEMDDDIPF